MKPPGVVGTGSSVDFSVVVVIPFVVVVVIVIPDVDVVVVVVRTDELGRGVSPNVVVLPFTGCVPDVSSAIRART